ncbi:MAG: chemotaxis protein CheW [Pyrinomonadaceae bacterium]
MAEELHLVTFRVGSELYGLPISAVQEIVRVPQVAHIPQAPEFVEGVINLRGRVITVVCMRKRLGAPGASGVEAGMRDRKSRILVVEAAGRLVGVVVDEVAEVLKLSADRVEQAPAMVAGLGNEYLNGVGKLEEELLILLDIDKILSAEQLTSVDQLQGQLAA